MLKSLRAHPFSVSSLPQRCFAAAAIAALSLPLISAPASTQELQQMPMRTLTVTGQGQEEVMTTKAQINLGIEVLAKTAADAQSEAAERSDAVVKFLKERKVDKLQTTGVSLSPRYDYNDGRQTLVGYTATNTVSFRVPNSGAGEIMDGAVKAGATQISGISFVAEDDAIATAQKQALKEATSDARAQADAVLDALNLKAKDVVSIQINGASAPSPVPYPMAAQFADSAALKSAPSTPIVGGEQQVGASVTLQIRY